MLDTCDHLLLHETCYFQIPYSLLRGGFPGSPLTSLTSLSQSLPQVPILQHAT